MTITSRNENFWEQRKLGNLFNERKEKSTKGELLSVTLSNGVTKFSDLNKKDNSNIKSGNYKVVKKNDIPYNSMRMWQGASGVSSYDGIVSPAYTVLVPNRNSNSNFYAVLFKKKSILNLFTRFSQGLTSDTWNLKYPILKDIIVPFTNLEEQKRIFKIFNVINNLLALYDRKLKLLSQVKKYFLDNLFAEKEYPNLRFKGFTDAWEQRKLGTITDTYSGGTPQVSVKDYYSNNEIPFIRSSDIHKNKTELYISSKGLENSSAKLVSKGHILYALYGATSGEVDISKIDGAINQAVLCINAHNDLNYFLMLFLSKNKDKIVRKYIQGGQGNLSASIIKKIKVFTTSELEETKISNLVKILSDIITLYENKQQHLTEIKKELLNTMFI
ncbi:MAG TPA: restriction endonuclease subunit S [Candidatus Caccosoma faecigallinarum]|uniref:Restriction endonuclease subunit S n=1 Tax=Candidatus Caccosoma faecigallinarum TaxID=2840720 RepID=A0A9D1G771_9FIRM|nr:restriction endonuclease subunit S [Candidatus Caccosoma faecigallinarum]